MKSEPEAFEELKKREWKPAGPGGARRRRLVWAAAAVVALVAVAYLAGVIRDRGAREAVEPAAEGPSPIISASGPVVPAKRARLSFTVGGRVKRLAVQPGDQVRQGQLLAQLEPSSVQSSELPGSGSTAPGGADLYIVAPFQGTVGQVSVREWETVTPGSPVVVVGDLSTMRVEIEDMPETDVGRLQVGQSAEVSFEAFPGRRVAGRLARISPMNNEKGGGVNYDVVVEFAEADLPPFRWGMTAHVDVRVEPGR